MANDKGDWKNVIGNSVDVVENMKSPRCIKTHLPWELLPKQLSTVKPKVTIRQNLSNTIFGP